MTLTVKDLKFSYASKPILKGVNFKLNETEIMCIVGPNGSGKSTLVKCIEGILKPQSGKVFLNDKDLSTIDTKEIAKIIGYVPQTSKQLFSSTVFDTVLMGRKPYTTWKSSDKDVDITIDVLTRMNLEDIALQQFNQLSGGQQQRVLIARALAQQPRILLLDEPTSALDISHQLEVMEIIHDLAHEQKIEVLMIVHDLNLAAIYADKIIMLCDGTVHVSGSVEEAFTYNNIANVYGVEAVINHTEGRISVVPIKRIENQKSYKNSVV